MKSSLVVKDLPRSADHTHDEMTLTAAQMKTLRGGRSVVVTVDGGSQAHVDDFAINTAIFEGRISGTYL
ncbi:hypothetical protein BCh11DRAFT_02859 [Burkholderia sp. Ch1-1]|uniref:Uncharacterized protein n=1 Tax=Paraburkholderia dioscoreae TaxID=2604047 RepID=A0A5Q4ZND1_9BURK|nr:MULTISPECIES: hypothetical protein [Paraburkholderia]EIF35046.1 hypothetical protein BCh11DRAFT_02859 [Burkholderia sp. Ch1-1]MDR8396396.1 hypothetical protein [Paraburkholderia sp. USG1]VVD34243.1 conserved protein of unknown function [Paraburkholderia dioscoreae]